MSATVDLITRDYPAACTVFAVERDGELLLDYADAANVNEEAFCSFASETQEAAAREWAEAMPEDIATGWQRRGEWEQFDEITWVLRVGGGQ